MYSIFTHGCFIADRIRMDAYEAALRQAVKPGMVVLDIGTGTGILAMLACRFDARRVYAIESSDCIQVARDLAASNGYADRITFIQGLSAQVTLPERADVIVSDLHGVLPFFRDHIPSIIDARRRFLAPGGVLIPGKETCWAAVVEASGLHAEYTAPWDDNGLGFDMSAARRLMTNTWRKARMEREQLVTDPHRWATLDYAAVEGPDIKAEMTWTAVRAGTAHGLCVWFDAMLGNGAAFTNAPGAPETIYGSAFFPWSAPVCLSVGDTVSAVLQGDLIGEDYVWRWLTRVLDQGRSDRIKAAFNQSTFYGEPLSPATLRKRAAGYSPKLNEDGEIDALVLGLMSSSAPLQEIAREVSSRFPARFPRWQDALTRAGELSQKYSL
jgi:protein arginine N-methyltransferase 1